MKVRIFTTFNLVVCIALLLAVLPGGMVPTSAQRPELRQSGIKAQATSKPIQEFTTTHPLEPIDVEIVALSLTDSGLGVGESITLTAYASPPLSQTNGVLEWTILSGEGVVDCGMVICATEVATLTLDHPGPISHDTSGVVVGVEYVAGSHMVSDTLSIPLNEPVYRLPYIRNFTLHFGGKPFPEPGDTVTVTLEHALPPGYKLISEHVEPASIVTDTETFVSVQLVAQAKYMGPQHESFFDVFAETFMLPFSYDKDHNGTPDLVDDQFDAAWADLQAMPLVPPSDDVWRAPKALVAHMIRIPFWPLPTFTFDPNCEPCVFGYYQWNGSKVNDLQLCPKAFITPLQFWVTLCHEMKHWWDEKIVGDHQGEKAVEQFGWRCGQLFWPFWTPIDVAIFGQMDPPVEPPPTFNVLWGSHVTWTLTLSNTNATYALENLQFRLESVMSSGGQYATGDTLGGGISVGANGLANTTAAGDDVQRIPVGQGRPHAIVIHPGPNGQLDTAPVGDDTLFPSEDRLTSGANGVVETLAQLDDVQVIPVGMGYTSTTFMPLAIGAGPNGVLDSSPQSDDQVVPLPSLPITNLQVTTPISIPAGGQGAVLVAFNVADYIPGASGSGVVQMVFELTAQQGGGLRRETFEIFLFLPPKVYLTTFADVPTTYWAWDWIERLYNAGITSGCGTMPLVYCPESSVTRAQMAIFLERGMNGSAYSPPAATGMVFADVPLSYWAVNWIEKLYADGITSGCGTSPLVYCPEDSVTRAQMAIFLLRAKYGTAYTPPNATGVFADVSLFYWAANWIEQLAAEGITSGCGTSPLVYCPDDPVTRAQMAVFLVRTFNLP